MAFWTPENRVRLLITAAFENLSDEEFKWSKMTSDDFRNDIPKVRSSFQSQVRRQQAYDNEGYENTVEDGTKKPPGGSEYEAATGRLVSGGGKRNNEKCWY